jgi:hypothetical protein
MALEITHIDKTQVVGVLDGALPFHVSRKKNKLSARIASWEKEKADRSHTTARSMRSAAYEMLARYRESQRQKNI